MLRTIGTPTPSMALVASPWTWPGLMPGRAVERVLPPNGAHAMRCIWFTIFSLVSLFSFASFATIPVSNTAIWHGDFDGVGAQLNGPCTNGDGYGRAEIV